jgi:hypothetical protein
MKSKDVRPEWQKNFDLIVLDRMLKYGETKEQAQNAVARFVMGIIGDSA